MSLTRHLVAFAACQKVCSILNSSVHEMTLYGRILCGTQNQRLSTTDSISLNGMQKQHCQTPIVFGNTDSISYLNDSHMRYHKRPAGS